MKLSFDESAGEANAFAAERQVRSSSHVDEVDAVSGWRAELDAFHAKMRDEFQLGDPASVFMALAAMSARMSEVRTAIARSDNRRWQSFRKAELDPFLEECERQYRFHSRALSVREQELRLSGGGM